jgi:hypothetical protein
MFWAVIKCDLLDRSDEAAFNQWYNGEHAPRYIAQPGFTRGWRLSKHDLVTGRDAADQRFQAIYEVANIAAFNAALDRDFRDGHPWEAWEAKITNWNRTYYEVLLNWNDTVGAAPPSKLFWTTVRIDFDARSPAEEDDFNAWYSNKHVPEVMRGPGACCAWRLKLAPDANDLGPRGQTYLAVYETDDPDYLRKIRSGAVPWDGNWAERIRNWQIGVYEKIFDHQK